MKKSYHISGMDLDKVDLDDTLHDYVHSLSTGSLEEQLSGETVQGVKKDNTKKRADLRDEYKSTGVEQGLNDPLESNWGVFDSGDEDDLRNELFAESLLTRGSSRVNKRLAEKIGGGVLDAWQDKELENKGDDEDDWDIALAAASKKSAGKKYTEKGGVTPEEFTGLLTEAYDKVHGYSMPANKVASAKALKGAISQDVTNGVVKKIVSYIEGQGGNPIDVLAYYIPGYTKKLATISENNSKVKHEAELAKWRLNDSYQVRSEDIENIKSTEAKAEAKAELDAWYKSTLSSINKNEEEALLDVDIDEIIANSSLSSSTLKTNIVKTLYQYIMDPEQFNKNVETNPGLTQIFDIAAGKNYPEGSARKLLSTFVSARKREVMDFFKEGLLKGAAANARKAISQARAADNERWAKLEASAAAKAKGDRKVKTYHNGGLYGYSVSGGGASAQYIGKVVTDINGNKFYNVYNAIPRGGVEEAGHFSTQEAGSDGAWLESHIIDNEYNPVTRIPLTGDETPQEIYNIAMDIAPAYTMHTGKLKGRKSDYYKVLGDAQAKVIAQNYIGRHLKDVLAEEYGVSYNPKELATLVKGDYSGGVKNSKLTIKKLSQLYNQLGLDVDVKTGVVYPADELPEGAVSMYNRVVKPVLTSREAVSKSILRSTADTLGVTPDNATKDKSDPTRKVKVLKPQDTTGKSADTLGQRSRGKYNKGTYGAGAVDWANKEKTTAAEKAQRAEYLRKSSTPSSIDTARLKKLFSKAQVQKGKE